MSPRSFLEFWKSPSGKLLGFSLVVGGTLALYGHYRATQRHPAMPPVEPDEPLSTNQVVQRVHRPMDLFRPPPPREPARPSATPVKAREDSEQEPPSPPPRPPEPLPVSLFADATAGRPRARARSEVYAPYGRLIPCETVITVDSSSIRTPIIGLITEDIYHGGRLVIPAGTEVHGSANVDRVRERIASGTAWTLVWQSGEELRLRGIALDREFQDATNHVGWGITDGSAGLRGRLIKSDDLAELKLFAATFLSGAAQALTEKEVTLLGEIDRRSLQNAPLKGAEEVLGVYADRILSSIQRDGFYLRVPSGKQFYLYVLQSLDRADARLPDGSPAPEPKEQESPAQIPTSNAVPVP